MKQDDILQTAVQLLSLQSGLTVQQTQANEHSEDKRSKRVRSISIQLDGGSAYELKAEMKNEIRGDYVGLMLNRRTTKSRSRILVSQYISKPNRVLLKQHGVNYLDASGNCYIRYKSLLLYINDNPVTAQRLPERGKLWKVAGLKMLFALLAKPALVNQGYRTIGTESNIALGMVGPLLKEMENEGFLLRTENGFTLENRDILMARWTENFQSHLRPKLSHGRFRFEDAAQAYKAIAATDQVKWGGETAAYILTGYLQPQRFTIYSTLPIQELIRQFHIMPDPQGDLEILSPFWSVSHITSSQQHCVPELLVYAELTASLDRRSREAAYHLKGMLHL